MQIAQQKMLTRISRSFESAGRVGKAGGIKVREWRLVDLRSAQENGLQGGISQCVYRIPTAPRGTLYDGPTLRTLPLARWVDASDFPDAPDPEPSKRPST